MTLFVFQHKDADGCVKTIFSEMHYVGIQYDGDKYKLIETITLTHVSPMFQDKNLGISVIDARQIKEVKYRPSPLRRPRRRLRR